MGIRVAIAIVVLAGCGATLEENIPADASSTDGRRSNDAPIAIDAPPVDARLCAGGAARATDPMTGSCFVYFTGPLTYVNAEAACTAFGSKLAVIKSAQTNATVRSLIGMTDAFIGASDRVAEGSFTWLGNAADPVTVGVTYSNWRAGEPNNANGMFEEDCAIIEGDQDGTWDDRPCAPPPAGAGAYAYVCQF